jgi:hypothetical protein
MAINFGGNVYDDAGNAVSGASVKLLETGTTTQEGSTVTTDSNGRWDFSEADQDRYDVEITKGSSVRRIKWSDEISLQEIDVRNNTGNTTPAATFTNLTDNTSNQVAVFSGANATRADGDEIYLSFKLADSAGNIDEFARMTVDATDVTSGSEDGQIRFGVAVAGTLTDVFTINSTTGGSAEISYEVDSFTIKGGEGEAGVLYLFADQGDDAGDEWKINVADGGVLTIGNDIASAGSYVTMMTITPHATTASSSVAIAGDATVGDDLSLTSDSSVFNMGADNDFTITHDGTTGATLAGSPITVNSTGALTLDSSTDITLDADGADVFLKDGGTLFGTLTNSSGELVIKSSSSGTTAITMSGADVAIAGDLTISGDDLKMATNTDTYILVADGTSYNPVAVSGDISIANNGAVTIANDSVESGMVNDNIISGQTELASGGIAAADEILISDGGTVKKIGVDNYIIDSPALVSEAAIANGDYLLFLDGGATGSAKKEALADLVGLMAGTVTSTGLSDASSVLKLDIQNMTASSTIADADLIVIDDGADGTLRKMTRANFIESAALDAINIDGGAIDAVTLGTNSAVTELQVDNLNIVGIPPQSSNRANLGAADYAAGDTRLYIVTEAGNQLILGNNEIRTNTGQLNLDAAGGIVINDDGDDEDFRIESNDDANLFNLDAGLNTITMGGAANANSVLTLNAANAARPLGTQEGTHFTTVGNADLSNSSGTVAIGSTVALHQAGYSAAGSTTVTHATTLYIPGVPVAGTNVTFTNTAYSLWVDAGNVRIDGDIQSGANLTFQNDSIRMLSGGDLVMFNNGRKIFVNDSASGQTSIGIIANQGGYDDQILELKSSDVSVAMTGTTDADTYGAFKKRHATQGGLDIMGLSEAERGINLTAYLGSVTTTQNSTSSEAGVNVRVTMTDGSTGLQAPTANANLFGVSTFDGSSTLVQFLVDEDGDLFANGSATTVYDAYDDTALVRAVDLTMNPEKIIRNEWDSFVRYNEKDLVDARLLGDTIANGGLVNVTGMQRLHNGAISQLREDMMNLVRVLSPDQHAMLPESTRNRLALGGA